MDAQILLCNLILLIGVYHTHHILSTPIKDLGRVPKPLNKEYGLALKAIFGIGVRMQTLLDANITANHNFIVSPISATVMIGQLMLGAEGKDQDYLYDLLSLPSKQRYKNQCISFANMGPCSKLPYATFHLQMANLMRVLERSKMTSNLFTLNEKSALFYNKNISLKEMFVGNLRTFYKTEIEGLDFKEEAVESQRTINQWAADNTNGKIREVLAVPPTPMTSSIFLNAVYFRGSWETPFSDMLNHNDEFYVAANKKVQTTYMVGYLEQVPYHETNMFKIMSIPYKNNELGMYVILPKDGAPYEYDINNFAQKLDVQEVTKAIKNVKRHDVSLKIPKMSLTTSFSILDPFKKYVTYKNQQNTTDDDSELITVHQIKEKIENFKNFSTNEYISDIYLTEAANNHKLRISDIIQQITFAINENGTEAAAVTAGIIDYIDDSKSFLVNKPFLFFIRHEATSATLFWGTISDPTKN